MSKKTLQYLIFASVLIIAIFLRPSGAYGSGEANILVNKNYRQYLEEHSDQPSANEEVTIKAVDYKDKSAIMDVDVYDSFEGLDSECILIGETGTVEWEIYIPESGMYNIELFYYPISGKGNPIERKIYIDGEIPYKEASNIYISRVWGDEGDIYKDAKGNDIRSPQIEKPHWRKTLIYDSLGYFNEPLMFYLDKGIHVIGFESVREPIVINTISIKGVEKLKTYAEIKAEYKERDYSEANIEPIKIQAEKTFEKSDNTLYPVADRSSAINEPQDPSRVRLNTISGDKWKMPRQWITWRFDVEEDGLYKIVPRYRQNILSGLYVNRKIILNGEVPFKEAEAVKFNYSNDWQVNALGDDEEDFIFYLEAGENELTMEATLGDLASVLNKVDECLYSLNEAYRKILMITGNEPDLYRDYGFKRLVPEAIDIMKEQAVVLRKVSADMEDYIGQKGETIVILDKIALQLEQMVKDPEKYIARSFKSLRENIGSLGTWLLTVSQQPLSIDYISIMPVSHSLPRAESSFFQTISFETKSFIMSFIADYNSLGDPNVSEDNGENDPLDIWISSGRDQAQIIREMVNDSFSPYSGIKANIKLVSEDTLLPSVLAGIGPDISLGNQVGDPIQYAIRNAVINIENMLGFDEVTNRFHPSALVPFSYGEKVYALPETQVFPMLFYRKDIFQELELEVPDTWDDFYEIIPEIQKRNMQIGFPTGISGLQIFLYQNGGDLYTPNRDKSTLDNDMTIEAFQRQIELFTSYKFPRDFDFPNRFRTGEMPMGIMEYTTYNNLIAFAPEIRGMWEFVPLPGIQKEDGSIDYTTPSTGTAIMMLNGVKDEKAAWEFMKWWTSADAQSRFAIEMESILGQSAKHATANIEALTSMPWTKTEYDNLMNQWECVRGTPEIPGGYYITRAVDFAAAAAYNNGDVEVLLDYVTDTNNEIDRKRKEFGLE